MYHVPPRHTASKSASCTLRKKRPVPSAVRFVGSGPSNASGVARVRSQPPVSGPSPLGTYTPSSAVRCSIPLGEFSGNVTFSRSTFLSLRNPANPSRWMPVALSNAPISTCAFAPSGSSRCVINWSATFGIRNSWLSGPRLSVTAAPRRIGRIARRVGMPAESCGRSSLFRCIQDTLNAAAMSVIGSAIRSNSCGTR